MSKRIAFGTAGLRGQMRAGFSGMNDLTVAQASQVFEAQFSILIAQFLKFLGILCLHS